MTNREKELFRQAYDKAMTDMINEYNKRIAEAKTIQEKSDIFEESLRKMPYTPVEVIDNA